MNLTIILAVIGGAVALFVLYLYNSLIITRFRVREALSQIDVQLKKRADLVPNLIETVKGYMKHEREIMDNVAKTRERMISGSMRARLKADGEFTKALKSIFAIAENYPQLRASENFRLLQEQLEGIESKIAFARQFYNDATLDFNVAITTIPGKWFASFFRLAKKEREYLETIPEERKPVKVKF